MTEMSSGQTDRSVRSEGNYEAGQQRYAVIEFCNTAEALWGKIRSGNWDWLGVKEDRNRRRTTFVLGRPALPVGELTASVRGVMMGATEGVNGYRIATPQSERRGEAPSGVWFASFEEAQTAFARKQGELLDENRPGSALFKLTLLHDGREVDTKLIVKARPTISKAPVILGFRYPASGVSLPARRGECVAVRTVRSEQAPTSKSSGSVAFASAAAIARVKLPTHTPCSAVRRHHRGDRPGQPPSGPRRQGGQDRSRATLQPEPAAAGAGPGDPQSAAGAPAADSYPADHRRHRRS
jgi:hypothetical protein